MKKFISGKMINLADPRIGSKVIFKTDEFLENIELLIEKKETQEASGTDILIIAKVINQPELFFPTTVLFHLLCKKGIIQFHPRLYYYTYQ